MRKKRIRVFDSIPDKNLEQLECYNAYIKDIDYDQTKYFPVRLKECMDKFNLSPSDVAYLIRSTGSKYVESYLSGCSSPTYTTLIKLSLLFDVDVSYLLGVDIILKDMDAIYGEDE